MEYTFYIPAAIALFSTMMVITRHHPVHALLYLIVSLLSLSLIFFLLGAPFAALLEIIIYAGAIMVLFIFVIMLLNLGKETAREEKQWLRPAVWIGPAILSLMLFAELIFLMGDTHNIIYNAQSVEPKVLAISLLKPYVIGVELAGILLMAGVIGAAHIGKQGKTVLHRYLERKERS